MNPKSGSCAPDDIHIILKGLCMYNNYQLLISCMISTGIVATRVISVWNPTSTLVHVWWMGRTAHSSLGGVGHDEGDHGQL